MTWVLFADEGKQKGISMFSDFVCALIPICLIRKLARSPVEKVLVSILLALCLLATVCGIPKLYYTITYDFKDKDGFYRMTRQFIWSRMEEALIVIAACAPLIKVPIERALLRWFGIELPSQPPVRDLETVVLTTRNDGGEVMAEVEERWPSSSGGSRSGDQVGAAGQGTIVVEGGGKEGTMEKTRSAATSTAELLPVSVQGSSSSVRR